MKCVDCGENGIFIGVNGCNDAVFDQFLAGVRICPNRNCRAITFAVHDSKEILEQFPPATLPVDLRSLPEPIASSMSEAAICFGSGAYRATALMVRRVLEELCADRGATDGRDLRERLRSLGDSTLIPRELIDAADELRLLGNDAAHIEAKNYDSVGQPEAEMALELAKELLKAVYQYSNLLQKLRALKK